MRGNGKTPAHQDVEQTTILRNDHEFARTLEVAEQYRDAEHKHGTLAFTFGDALIEECGDPGPRGVRTGSKGKLVTAQKFLEQQGFAYSIAHLRDLRKVAWAIPDADRSASVSWTVYRVAGNAETVEATRKFAEREDLTHVTVADVKEFLKERRKDEKVERDKKAQQEWEKANPGKPRPDPARVSATHKFLATAAQVRALWIKVARDFKHYPELTSEEVMALDAMLRVPLRILEAHEGHDMYTGEPLFWNEVHEEEHDLPAVKDASPAPQDDTESEQLHWTGDEYDGFLGRGLVQGKYPIAYIVVPVTVRGLEHFEAKVLSGSDVDLTVPLKELADRYGKSLTKNDRKGQRRTLDPFQTPEAAREHCELAYHSASSSAT